MKNYISKWISIPSPGETKQLEATQLWEVRWSSRYGEFSGNLSPEAEFFTSEKEAEEFRDALVGAFRILKHSGHGTRVTMGKVPQ